jgi:alginate O-acetyltransferase complex protein AlgI
MSFTVYSFLLLFLPLTLATYFLTPARLRVVPLLLCSWIFYGLWNPWFLALLIAVTTSAYGFGRLISSASSPSSRRRLLTVGVVLNLAALAYFKYAQFGLETLNRLLNLVQHAPLNASIQGLLPVGLSFYVFNAIAYLIDVSRNETTASSDPLRFAASFAFFASLLNGPLLRQAQITPQLLAPQVSLQGFGAGAMRFMIGFCKKLLIADTLSPLVQGCFASSDSSSAANVWLGGLAYTVQLYYDFSGYSDMAIGVAAMLGIVLPENFNHPYTALSITEFWQRWHMSLSSFLKRYVYFSLGGNRHGEIRTYFNLLATMLIGGLWHGANWTFVLWGAWNGGFLMLERFLKNRFKCPAPPAWYALPKMMVVVILGRFFFISSDAGQALEKFAAAFGLRGWELTHNAALVATPERLTALGAGLALCYIAPHWHKLEFRVAILSRSLLLPVFWLALALVAARSASPFLYFRF